MMPFLSPDGKVLDLTQQQLYALAGFRAGWKAAHVKSGEEDPVKVGEGFIEARDKTIEGMLNAKQKAKLKRYREKNPK